MGNPGRVALRLSEYLRKGQTVLSETDRVVTLPQVWSFDGAKEWADKEFKRPDCLWEFRQAQHDALYAMSKAKGLLAPIGVGHGKTLIAWLASRALGVERSVIMLPPRDVEPFKKEVERYNKHFDPGPCVITYVPYSTLSQPNASGLLEALAPQAIICDEVHCLADKESVRTRRFLRYMNEHPDTLFVGMSGTLYKKSVTDVSHLAALALRDKSPMPRDGEDLAAWSRILDVRGMAEAHEYAWFEGAVVNKMSVPGDVHGKIERSRKAAYIRLASSEGVVTTEAASCSQELTLHRVNLVVPAGLQEKIDQIRATRASLDGEDIYATEAHLVGAMRNMASGFSYKYDWAAIGGRNEDWLMRRTAWLRELSSELRNNSRQGYDSPFLVSQELDRRLLENPALQDKSMLFFSRAMWNEVSHLPEPPRITVWHDMFMVETVLRQYRDREVILWYDSQAVEEYLTSQGVTCHGAASSLEGPARFLAASVQAHGQGRNLQDWNHGVVMEPGLGGAVWEQLLGRMHRQGQKRAVTYDIVVAGELYDQSLSNARNDARFIQTMSGSPQRLLYCNWT